MTVTDTDDEVVQEPPAPQRFVIPDGGDDLDPSDGGGSSDSGQEGAAGGMSRASVVLAGSLVLAAVLVLVLAAGFAGGPVQVSEKHEKRAFDLRQQIQQAETQAEDLPETKDAQRGLTIALEQAEQVEQLQNDYRSLTPETAQRDGVLPVTKRASIRRNLVPLFAPDEDASAVEPWYLLTADKDSDIGLGTPQSFASKMEWQAQAPATVTDDGVVRVTWLARQKTSEKPQVDESSPVLAWAQADFDMVRQTFSEVETGSTARGEGMRLGVKNG